MTLLLDTHVLLWWPADDPRLSPAMVSAASGWEVAVKASVGTRTVPEGLERHGFDDLPITVEDGLAAGALPRHHSDPFDRVLIVQAARRRFVLVTADRRCADYDVPTLS